MPSKQQFGDFEPLYTNPDTARIAILPVPYDGSSTWVKGADKGPQAILELDKPEQVAKAVCQRATGMLDKGKFPVILGGEHSVSIGAFEAMANCYDDLTVLQLDAHADLRDSYESSTHSHACVMARAKEYAPIVQVGIRSMDISEKKNDMCHHQGVEWIERVVSLLTENVYLTIDLDVFDPSVMPATGTPEPGGLEWYDMIALIRAVCSRRNLVGFDIVELCPREHLWASNFLAAKLLYKTLTYKFCL
ncbi:MAG: agmatinase [Planctomycetota bacterium]|jgi:agmatinase